MKLKEKEDFKDKILYKITLAFPETYSIVGLQSLTIKINNPTVKELENATSLSSYYENILKSENIPFKFSIFYNNFSINFDDHSFSESSTGEEEEEEDTESSSEDEDEEVTESSSEEEEEEVTESSSEEGEEDIESNINDESDTENHI